MSDKTQKAVDPGFARIVERQMRNWELTHQTAAAAPRKDGRVVQDFIALSRCVGLPGQTVAQALAQRLGWPLFDKDILEIMAGDDEYRRRLYKNMDERDLGWLESVIHSFGGEGLARDDYFHRLQSTVLALARKGSAIFLGRAADLILPSAVGLRVRLHASREYCIRTFAEEHQLPEKEAARQVDDVEHERAKFIRHHFRVDAESPTRHDLILNMERWPVASAVDIILDALRVKCGKAPQGETASSSPDARREHEGRS